MTSIKERTLTRAAAIVCACAIALAAWLVAQPAQTAYAADDSDTVEVYRVYNKWSNEHFYTSDQEEYEGLVDKGWNDEGVGWVAPATGDPVYRLYNKWSGDHHFTTDKSEYEKCQKAGWTGEKVAFFSAGKDKLPVYRLFNPYEKKFFHHYTMNKTEYNQCTKNGWTDEHVGWYAVAEGWGPTPAPSTGGNGNVGNGSNSTAVGDMVLIAASGNGNKYHRLSGCRSLNPSNGKQISLADAKRLNYEPCKNCFH